MCHYLLHMCVIEVHPLAYLGLEEEGGVMLAVVANHAHKVELRLLGPLIRHTVEQLEVGHKDRIVKIYSYCSAVKD